MEKITMTGLLTSDEERVLNTLRADQTVDRDRDRSVKTLSDELGSLLLRYNADNIGDRRRQAAADSMTTVARDSLDLLKTQEAELQKGERSRPAGAAYLLVLALALCFAAGFLLRTRLIIAPICLAGALVCAFFAGRYWVKETPGKVVRSLNPDGMWHTLVRVAETMDRKIEELAEIESAQETKTAGAGTDRPLGEEELALAGELLEALYSGSGEFALQKLRLLREYLRGKGIELADYDGENEDCFEVLPSKRETVTLRPAMLYEDRLLSVGRAAKPAG